ncbi:MAG: AhpC/TSA family protein [Crocinitomicaceae bacterium]|nr:AhpC/TSA family protein [Crocinitomicaceae bacterium]
MKKTFLLAFLILNAVVWSQEKIEVSGTIFNPKGDWVYLQNWKFSDNTWITVVHDSCKLDNGEFILTTTVDSMTNFQLFDGNEFARLYIDKGEKVRLEINTQYFDEMLMFSGTGSERNNYMAKIFLLMEANDLEREFYYQLYKNSENSDTTQYFKMIEFVDSSFRSLMDFSALQFPELKTVFLELSEDSKSSTEMDKGRVYKQIAFNQMKKEEIGKRMEDAKGINLEGKEVKISDYFGKITVVDFWATWCGPCKAEFPALHELEKKYKDQVTFLGIASFCKQEDWEKMAKEEGFEHSIFITKEDLKEITTKYSIQTIPRYMILDENGNIIDLDAKRPSSGLDDELQKLLK